jgi:hypothetical protein
MGVLTPEIGYTSATTRRGNHEVHKGHVVALGRRKITLFGLQGCNSTVDLLKFGVIFRSMAAAEFRLQVKLVKFTFPNSPLVCKERGVGLLLTVYER